MCDPRTYQCLETSSEIENAFKRAQVCQIRKDFVRAIPGFRSVILSLQRLIFANPTSQIEIYHVPLSLGHLSEIYHELQNDDKAIALAETRRHFLTYLARNKPNKEHENSTDDADTDSETTVNDLFQEATAAMNLPDPPPPPDPQDVVKMVMEAAKQYEAKRISENMQKLERIRAEREAQLANSRWERGILYIEDHPLRVASVAVFVMILIIGVAITTLRRNDQRSLAKREAQGGPERKVPKLSEENRAKIQGLFDRKKKMKGKPPPPPDL
jgi:hypothetical protein